MGVDVYDDVYDDIGSPAYSASDGKVFDNWPLINTSVTPVYAAYNVRTGLEYAFIQDAIDMAAPGDTVLVYDGEHDEDLEIDQRLTLILVYHYFAVYLGDCNNATIQGNRIEDTVGGIFLGGSNNCRVTGNDMTTDEYEIDMSLTADENRLSSNSDLPEESGVMIVESENCTIDNNDIEYYLYGIAVTDSLNVTVRDNDMKGVFDYSDGYDDYSRDISIASAGPGSFTVGVCGTYSDNVTVLKNDISCFDSGICLYVTENDTFRDNNITYSDSPDKYVEKSMRLKNTVSADREEYYVTDLNGILLESADNVTIQSNNVTHFELGLGLYDASNVTIRGNNVTGSGFEKEPYEGDISAASAEYYGIAILLAESPNNTIVNNNVGDYAWGIVLDNNDFYYGSDSISGISGDMIAMTYTENNTIYLNYLIDNYYSSFDLSGLNHWNSTATRSYSYHGVGHVNYTGNYWSDYTGKDANGDGIGDTPMAITNPYLIGSLSDSGVKSNTWTMGTDYFPMILELQRSPKAGFHANVTTGNAPFSVQLVDDSRWCPDHWNWQFGDGTANATVQNPVHIYTKPGMYLVNLTATNDYGSDTITMEDMDEYIIVLPALPSNLSMQWLNVYSAADGYDSYGYGVARMNNGFAQSGYVNGPDYYATLVVKTNNAGTVIYDQTYDVTDNYRYYDLVEESDGGITYAGQYGYNDIFVNQTFPNGTVNWTRRLTGTYGSYGVSIDRTSDGGYVVCGCSASSWGCPYMAKLNADGTVAWQKTLNEMWNVYYNVGYAHAVKQTPDGEYIVAGIMSPTDTNNMVYLAKVFPNGTLNWSKVYGGTISCGANDIIVTADGDFLITGSRNVVDTDGATRYKAILMKVEADGTEAFTKTYGDPFTYVEGCSLINTSDNGYLIAATRIEKVREAGGYEWPLPPTSYLIKTLSDGTILWNATLNMSI
jgi:parallel beta-helix repeat protein